jgi:hypothetical protein
MKSYEIALVRLKIKIKKKKKKKKKKKTENVIIFSSTKYLLPSSPPPVEFPPQACKSAYLCGSLNKVFSSSSQNFWKKIKASLFLL